MRCAPGPWLGSLEAGRAPDCRGLRSECRGGAGIQRRGGRTGGRTSFLLGGYPDLKSHQGHSVGSGKHNHLHSISSIRTLFKDLWISQGPWFLPSDSNCNRHLHRGVNIQLHLLPTATLQSGNHCPLHLGEEVRPRLIKSHAHSHTAGTVQKWDQNTRLSPEPVLPPSLHP